MRLEEALFGVDDLLVSGYRRQAEGVVGVRFDGPGARTYDVRVQATGLGGLGAQLRRRHRGPPTDDALIEVNGD